jgi:branched-chain amino acid transport system substrate-binding protein
VKENLRPRKTFSTILAGLCVLTTVLMLASFSTACSAPVGSTSASPIKIGAVIPMTGATADTGKIMKEAMQLAVEQAGGKVANRTIELVFEDSANDSNTALEKAKKEIQVNGVQVMVLDPMQAIAGAISSYLATVPALGLNTVARPMPPEKLGWTLLGGGQGYQYSKILGIYCAKTLGWKTATTIGSDFVSGRNYTQDFTDAFTANGGSVIQSQWSPPFIPDYGPFLTGMKKADGVMSAIVIPVNCMAFMKQYHEFGLTMPVAQTVSGALSEKYLNQIPAAVNGMYGSTPYATQLDNKQNADFIKAYMAKFNELPEYEAASTYAVMQVLLAALEQTKGDTTPATLRSQILGSKIDTVVGPMAWSPEGATYVNVYAVQAGQVGNTYTWIPKETFTNVPPKGH